MAGRALPHFSPYRGSLGGSVHLDTEVVAVPLPVQLAVHHVEQVTHTDLLAGGHLRQGHPGRDVLVLGNPVGYDVIARRPREVPAREGRGSCSLITKKLALSLSACLPLLRMLKRSG